METMENRNGGCKEEVDTGRQTVRPVTKRWLLPFFVGVSVLGSICLTILPRSGHRAAILAGTTITSGFGKHQLKLDVPRKGMPTISLTSAAPNGVTGRYGFVASLWGAKPVAIERLPKLATFPVLLPQGLSNRFKLDRAEIVWVAPAAIQPNVAGRRVVCLWYRVGDEGTAMVIQTAAVQGADPGIYLHRVAGRGYFYAMQPNGSLERTGTRVGNTDFMLIGMNATFDDLDELSKALLASTAAK